MTEPAAGQAVFVLRFAAMDLACAQALREIAQAGGHCETSGATTDSRIGCWIRRTR